MKPHSQGARLLAGLQGKDNNKKQPKKSATPQQGSYRQPHDAAGARDTATPRPRPIGSKPAAAPASAQRPGWEEGPDPYDFAGHAARDQTQPDSSAGNEFLKRLAGAGARPQHTGGAARAPAHHALPRLQGIGGGGGGGLRQFSRGQHHTHVAGTGAPGRQAAITDYLAPGHGAGSSSSGGAGFGFPPGLQVRLPAGMVNHGNTCYLNAVLQALLSMPAFALGLRSGRLAELQLPSDGVVAALQACLQDQASSAAGGGAGTGAAGSSGDAAAPSPAPAPAGRPAPISPGRVRAAMARRSARWGGARQEDAHEFLTELLDAVQREVLGAQALGAQALGAQALGAQAAAAARRSPPAVAYGEQQRQDVTAMEQDGVEEQGQQQAGQQQAAQQHQLSVDHDPQQQAQQQEQNQQEPHGNEQGQQQEQQQQQQPEHQQPAAQWQRRRRRLSVRLSDAACPASRAFTGCLQHELRCQACGHVTTLKEQFSCLSLDLPAPGASPLVATPLDVLVAAFFAPEELTKACDACGAAAAPHTLRHALRRLPPVLVVHLKRFSVQLLEGVGAVCRKLSARVAPAPTLDLSGVVLPGRRVPPPLAELLPPCARGGAGGAAPAVAAACDSDKENAANHNEQQQQQQQQQPTPAHQAPNNVPCPLFARKAGSRIAGMQGGGCAGGGCSSPPPPMPPSAAPALPSARVPLSPDRVGEGSFFAGGSGGGARGALVGGTTPLQAQPAAHGNGGGGSGGGSGALDGLNVLGLAAGSLQIAGGGGGGAAEDEEALMARVMAESLATFEAESAQRQRPREGGGGARQDEARPEAGADATPGGCAAPQSGSAALSAGMHFSGGGAGSGGGSGGGGSGGPAPTPDAALNSCPPCAGDSLAPAAAAPGSPPCTPPRIGSATGSPAGAAAARGRGLGRGGGARSPPINLAIEEDEDEQVRRAMEASLREYQAAGANGGGGSGGAPALGTTDRGGSLPSAAAGDATPAAAAPAAAPPPPAFADEDDEATLLRVLAESEAEFLEKQRRDGQQQQQQQQGEGGGGDAEVVVLDVEAASPPPGGAAAHNGAAASAARAAEAPLLVQLLEDSDDEPASDGERDGDRGGGGGGGEPDGTPAGSGGRKRRGRAEGGDGAPAGGSGDDQAAADGEARPRCKRRAASAEPGAAAAAAGADASLGAAAPAAPTPLMPRQAQDTQPPGATAAAAAGAGGKAKPVANGGAEGLLQEHAALYRLRAVVRHKGPLASSGHFVADVQTQEDPTLWIHYDDSFVATAARGAVLAGCKSDGYLFFFVNARANCGGRRGGAEARR
ncbi:hypothetical protein Rsub_07392 [Raphidocelis subcapitata]|uniref:USP domain-containing protein n=1 Tax=Raphidocelis subcapitata TaxID=307507 RepID=A0A2V0P475_9CHLO|nr:hypothetical protein Rsub_07392 [Raphidocelis subcapitata]|eukprot:GBF94656.1 hypothetical protein Rsub_07392 [Raphidocelis subcapitata]